MVCRTLDTAIFDILTLLVDGVGEDQGLGATEEETR